MLYMVSFHLASKEQYYSAFYRTLNELGKNTMVFPGTYLVDSSYTALGIRNNLIKHLGNDDYLLVSKMFSGYCAGKLDAHARDFMIQGS